MELGMGAGSSYAQARHAPLAHPRRSQAAGEFPSTVQYLT
jgi:hypothetical protein